MGYPPLIMYSIFSHSAECRETFSSLPVLNIFTEPPRDNKCCHPMPSLLNNYCMERIKSWLNGAKTQSITHIKTGHRDRQLSPNYPLSSYQEPPNSHHLYDTLFCTLFRHCIRIEILQLSSRTDTGFINTL